MRLLAALYPPPAPRAKPESATNHRVLSSNYDWWGALSLWLPIVFYILFYTRRIDFYILYIYKQKKKNIKLAFQSKVDSVYYEICMIKRVCKKEIRRAHNNKHWKSIYKKHIRCNFCVSVAGGHVVPFFPHIVATHISIIYRRTYKNKDFFFFLNVTWVFKSQLLASFCTLEAV